MSLTDRRSARDLNRLLYVPICLVLSAAAGAQDPKPVAKNTAADNSLQEIIVTGSRIARPDLDRLEPTTVVTDKMFDERGYTDVGQALSELPGFGVTPSSAGNVQSTNGIAQSFVDLYGLGSQRTLTLVDGRRFVSSNSPAFGGTVSPGGQVDLNNIPTKLIERIETISVGGAPIYGADAISGTVNIILKHDYQGADVDVQFGRSGQHDADSERIRTLFGTNFSDGRGNITLSGEFSKANGLYGTSRSVYAADAGFLKPLTPGPYKNVYVTGQTVQAINYGGIPFVDDTFFADGIGLPSKTYGVTNGAGQVVAFGNGLTSGSNLVPYNVGTLYNNPVFSTNGDGERLSQVSNLLSPLEKINTEAIGHFQFNDNLRLFGEAWFSGTHAESLITQPQYNTALFGPVGSVNGNLKINLNNPFLPAAARTLIQNALNAYQASNPQFQDPNWSPNSFYLSRASVDLQSGKATANQQTYRGVVGLDGKFDLGEHTYKWEVAANYGRSRNASSQPSLIFQNFNNALNAVTNASGQIVCAPGYKNAPTSSVSSTCAPLNIFGFHSPSLAAEQYITHLAQAESITTQRDVTATINGDLFKLPAGEVKASLGYENRRESAAFSPDDFYINALGTSAAVLPIEGAYRTNEVFGELLVPIFSPGQDITMLHNLEFEGAIRRVNNSIAGNATTWTEGLRWSPVRDLQFRGNKTRSIRAPAVTELFLPSVPQYSFANDPCDSQYIGQGGDPATRAKNCAAAGIKQPFNSNIVNATAIGTSSGNQNLTSETADSQSVGFVLQPRWISHLNVTVDYIDIKLTNAIESLDLTTIMDSCYDSTDYPANSYCGRFTRNAQGQVTTFQTGYVNAGNRHFTGIATGADYRFDVPAFGGTEGSLGNVDVRANYLDTRRLTTQVGSVPVQEVAGQLAANGSANGQIKSRGTLDVAYQLKQFGWSWQAQYLGPANFNNQNPTDQQQYAGVSHWWVVNSTLSYIFPHDITTRLVVDNVTNKEPPFPAIAGSGGNYTTAVNQYFTGVMGRYFLLSADMHF